MPQRQTRRPFLHRTLFLIAAFAAGWPAPPARAETNAIDRVSVVSESAAKVTFDVTYRYGGDHGTKVFVSVVMAQNGKTSSDYAYHPARVLRGRHTARVTLGVRKGAPAVFSSNQILVAMYVGNKGSFVERNFAFSKTWSHPGAALSPVFKLIGAATPPPHATLQLATPPGAGGHGGSGGSGGAPARRILPNGHVELRFADGTVRERYRGGESITYPDGRHETRLYSSAQPPTPPSVPPDEAHSVWLSGESDRLLDIIRTLVNDDASVEHYLSQEGSAMSPYQRITSRTEAVNMLTRP